VSNADTYSKRRHMMNCAETTEYNTSEFT